MVIDICFFPDVLLQGENLIVIDKQSDHWWIAKNSRGFVSLFIFNYFE